MATGGRLFVLFTSQDMLRKTYDLITESEQLEEYALFAQGITFRQSDEVIEIISVNLIIPFFLARIVFGKVSTCLVMRFRR